MIKIMAEEKSSGTECVDGMLGHSKAVDKLVTVVLGKSLHLEAARRHQSVLESQRPRLHSYLQGRCLCCIGSIEGPRWGARQPVEDQSGGNTFLDHSDRIRAPTAQKE